MIKFHYSNENGYNFQNSLTFLCIVKLVLHHAKLFLELFCNAQYKRNNFCDPRKILHNTNSDMMHQITNVQFHARTHIAGY